MPIYTFKCTRCDKQLDILSSWEDAKKRPPVCPDCSDPMDMIPGVSSFAFKGSGFYSTDNPKGGGRIK